MDKAYAAKIVEPHMSDAKLDGGPSEPCSRFSAPNENGNAASNPHRVSGRSPQADLQVTHLAFLFLYCFMTLTPACRFEQDPTAAERELAALLAEQALVLHRAEEIAARIAALGGVPVRQSSPVLGLCGDGAGTDPAFQ